MVKARLTNFAINAGEFGPEMLGRIDFDRYSLAGRRVENWLPRVTGGMERTMGFRVIEEITGDVHMRGFQSVRDLGYLVLFQPGATRFYYDDSAVFTQNPSTILNGTFAAGLAGWQDSSTGTGTVAGGAGLVLTVPASTTGVARLDQNITGATPNGRHNIEVVVAAGPVAIDFGSEQGATDLRSGVVDTGTHVFEVAPTGIDFWMRISSSDTSPRTVTSVSSVSGAPLVVANTFTAADLQNIRGTQQSDTMFLASGGKPLSSLSRRGESAFGFGVESLIGGPFKTANTSSVSLTPSAVSGDITLVADDPFFEAGSVGKSYQIIHTGQFVTGTLNVANTFTTEIEISGSGTQFRRFNITISGQADSTITLQRSIGAPGSWTDVQAYGNGTTSYDDNLDGQTIFYRIGIKAGDYGTDTVTATLDTVSGSTTGEVEITSFANDMNVTARVRVPLGSTAATDTFSQSVFGGENGYPIEAEFQEGRLFIASETQLFGSQSDDFTNFTTGLNDADAIDRRTKSDIRWLVSIGDLGVGENVAASIARSGDFDQPYTPSNFRLRPDITRGAAFVEPVAVEAVGIYVDRDKETLREIVFDGASNRAIETPLTRLNPRIGLGGIKRIQYQRAPENRIWCVKETGELIAMTYARAENVVGWSRRKVNGTVVDIGIAEGSRRDRIYAVIDRQIAGATRRFLCIMDNEYFTHGAEANHLDFSYTPIRPDAPAWDVQPSGITGTITIRSDVGGFAAGDVGKRLFMAEGQATVATFVSANEITATVIHPLANLNRVAAGFWWMGAESTALTGLVGLESQTATVWADGVESAVAVDAGGNATLATAAAWVHVGLSQPDSVFESLKLVAGGRRGAATNGVTKRAHEVGVSVLRTGPSLFLGVCAEDNVFKAFDPDVFIDGQIATAEHRQSVEGSYEFDASAFIVARGAAPATILSYSAELSAHERG